MFDRWVGGALSRDSFWDCCGRHRHTGSPRWHQRMFTWPYAHQAVHVYAWLILWQMIRCPGITGPCCGCNHNLKQSRHHLCWPALCPIPVLCDIFTLFPSCLFLQKRVYPEEVELVKSIWLDPQGCSATLPLPGNFFLFSTGMRIKVQNFLLELDRLLLCDVTPRCGRKTERGTLWRHPDIPLRKSFGS